MSERDPAERDRALAELAGRIRGRGLAAPARMILDVVAPLGIIASQTALLVQPLVPHGRWRSYVGALCDERGWETLQGILNGREC